MFLIEMIRAVTGTIIAILLSVILILIVGLIEGERCKRSRRSRNRGRDLE